MSTAEAQAEFGRTLARRSARPATESSNRQNHKLGVVETSSRPIYPDPNHKVIEDACKKALISWPNANAAILFGSRSRGDHRDDSDWDIAFVTGKEEPLPDALLKELKCLETRDRIIVQGLAISQTRFCEGASSLGNISVPIAQEGRLIAGYCEWPTTEGEPILKPHEYAQWRGSALMHIASASTSLATAIESAREGVDLSDFGWFVARSSDGAELCAKIAFGKITSGIRRMDVLESARRLCQTLQDIDLNDTTFAVASSVLAESTSAVVNFGEETVQAIQKLADKLHSDTETTNRI